MTRSLATILCFLLTVTAGAEPPAPDGKALYGAHCGTCHGMAGRGDGVDAGLFLAHPRKHREGFVRRYDDDQLVDRILDGVPLALELDPKAFRRHLTELDDVIAHLERIPDVNWKLVEPGQELYVDRCEQCHGPYGRPPDDFAGLVAPPADLSRPEFQRSHGDEELIQIVRRGHKLMPAIPAVRSDADARALLAYLRLLSPGFDTYSRYCAACHG